ncbi:hypothetical protein ACEN88_00460 [Massilia sp. CT11-108]|uniref:hypothetical protein n=1 Tax=Massilia sp. CT11-108 TaxID=3393900 RepID=UPI0039A4F40E
MLPIDYTTDIANPFDSVLKGYQAGIGISQVQQQQQQQQAALAQKQQQAQVIQSLVANPNAGGEEYANAMLQVPGMSEQLKQAWDTKSAVAQKQQLSDLAQWGSAIQNGQPQIVVDGLNARADAIENASNGPTVESRALRAKAQAVQEHPEFGGVLIKSMLAVHPQGKAVIDNIVAQNKDARDQKESDSKLDGEKIDQAVKNYGVFAQTAGSLAKPGVKPAQAITMFKSMESRGFIPKGGAQEYIDGMPADPKELPTYLGQLRDAGMTPKDQKAFTTPSADATLSASTQRRGQDIRHSEWVEEQKAADAPAKPNETLAKQIAFYRAPPLGQFNMNKPWGQATMDMVMQLNPQYDAAQYAPRAAALRSFGAGGKDGAAIESANTAMNHLATLKELALAQKNGDTRLFNKIANRISEATGGAAPSNLKVAVQMVAPEVVKAVSGVGGTGEDRKHTADALAGDGTYSPDQVLGAVGTAQELFGGRLKEKKRSYERGTGLKDFEDTFLSPAARSLLTGKGGGEGNVPPSTKPAKSAPAHPADIDYLLNKYGN